MYKDMLQEGDILVFKNGHKKEYNHKDNWMLDNFYDDNLVCLTNDVFTIVKILRPKYTEIYSRVRKKVEK